MQYLLERVYIVIGLEFCLLNPSILAGNDPESVLDPRMLMWPFGLGASSGAQIAVPCSHSCFFFAVPIPALELLSAILKQF